MRAGHSDHRIALREQAAWLATCRREAVRLARHIRHVPTYGTLVAEQAPELTALTAVGSVLAAAVLIALGSHPGRVGFEAAFAAIAGAPPSPTRPGTQRDRLNRGRHRWSDPANQAGVARRPGWADRGKGTQQGPGDSRVPRADEHDTDFACQPPG